MFMRYAGLNLVKDMTHNVAFAVSYFSWQYTFLTAQCLKHNLVSALLSLVVVFVR